MLAAQFRTAQWVPACSTPHVDTVLQAIYGIRASAFSVSLKNVSWKKKTKKKHTKKTLAKSAAASYMSPCWGRSYAVPLSELTELHNCLPRTLTTRCADYLEDLHLLESYTVTAWSVTRSSKLHWTGSQFRRKVPRHIRSAGPHYIRIYIAFKDSEAQSHIPSLKHWGVGCRLLTPCGSIRMAPDVMIGCLLAL